MPRVLHNTVGCHPLRHTEAHKITHLCASRPRKIVDEHEASRRLGLTFPGAASLQASCLPKSSTRLRYNFVIQLVAGIKKTETREHAVVS
eukprot:1269883-Prymnesium_polylepis.1